MMKKMMKKIAISMFTLLLALGVYTAPVAAGDSRHPDRENARQANLEQVRAGDDQSSGRDIIISKDDKDKD